MNQNDVTTLYQGRWLRLSKRGTWEYAERTNPGGAAIILAITPEEKVIFIEQFRAPIQKQTIEFPAGLIGDEPDAAEEEASQAAARELEEETGWRAAVVDYVHGGPSSAGMSTEYQHFFRARKLTRVGPGGGLPGENITVHEIEFARAAAFLHERVQAGFAVDPKVYAGLYFLSYHADGKPLPDKWWLSDTPECAG